VRTLGRVDEHEVAALTFDRPLDPYHARVEIDEIPAEGDHLGAASAGHRREQHRDRVVGVARRLDDGAMRSSAGARPTP
jgi:hypothetical protein